MAWHGHAPNRLSWLLGIALLFAVAAAGCGRREHPQTLALRQADAAFVTPLPAPEAEPTLYNALDDKTRAPLRLEVVELKQTFGYTWLRAKDSSGEGWIAAPMLRVPVGATVEVSAYAPSGDFDADLIPASVPTVLFATMVRGPRVAVAPAGEYAAIHPLLPAGGVTDTDLEIDLPSIAKVDHDIAELHIRRFELRGRVVAVRGQVVKVAPSIAGRQVLFLRDGSGDRRTGILPVLCDRGTEPGSVVVVIGRVGADVRFPHGGTHRLLLLGARLADEKADDLEAVRARVAATPAPPPWPSTPTAAPAAATPEVAEDP